MSAIIGKIVSTDGEFYAKGIDGSLRRISNGDEIYEGETIVGAKGNSSTDSIIVSMNDGTDIVILGDETQLFDSSLTEKEFAENETVTHNESIQAMLRENGDLDDTIDELETAAGEDSGVVESTDGGEAHFAQANNASTDINAELRTRIFDTTAYEVNALNQNEEARRVENDIAVSNEVISDLKISSMAANVAELNDAADTAALTANEAAAAADTAAAAAQANPTPANLSAAEDAQELAHEAATAASNAANTLQAAIDTLNAAADAAGE
ncbi:hypothetical protein KKG72_11645, partial [bacterium]|nr:hypothetical protein [bacterium]MBU1994738.1 hypothetical protein [bacterium]